MFQACRGFHPDIGPPALQRYQGDGETGLTLKAREAGYLALYHPAVSVKHMIPASRLTAAYFERRSYYQGVCDSYTRIRRDGSVPAVQRSWKDLVRPLKRLLQRTFASPGQAIQVMMGRAHAAGFAFHQDEVRRDRRLLEWVLRPDYFDYALPQGWRSYLPPES